MERRIFLRSGLALGAIAVGGHDLRWLIERDPLGLPTSSEPLRLNSNENPLGLAPMARRAVIEGLAEANRYPRAMREQLVERLAELNRVPAEAVVLGNGSTEVLQMAVQALAVPESRLVLADPTFEDVPWYGEPLAYRLEKIPLGSRHAHDLVRMRQAARTGSGAALVYICNPNNPTGTLTSSAQIDAWIESAPESIAFLVDEAYYEYCDAPAYWSCVKWTAARRNVIVTRSFSKIYGMAGMRLGYGIAHPETAARLRQYIGRNNANHLALVAALASLDDPDLVRRSREANARGMAILHECLKELGLEYLPSYTNFVMHRIHGDLDTYRTRMEEHRIRVGRPFPPMLDYNRLSIGLPEEMARFAETLRSFRRKGWV